VVPPPAQPRQLRGSETLPVTPRGITLPRHDQRGYFQGALLVRLKTEFRWDEMAPTKKTWLKVFPRGFGKDFNVP